MWWRRSAAVQREKEDGTVGEMAGAVQRSSARCCSKMEERGVGGVRCGSAHVEEGEIGRVQARVARSRTAGMWAGSRVGPSHSERGNGDRWGTGR
jgi:hypothetical protein